MDELWRIALEILDSDAALAQEVITLLASDGGMLRIAELLRHEIEGSNEPRPTREFSARLLPFLKTFSHTNVVTSAILEGRLVSIYNYVFGHGGERGTRLFTIIADHLSYLQSTAILADEAFHETLLEHFDASITVLSKMVELNTTAQINEGLQAIVDRLRIVLNASPHLAVVSALSSKLSRIEQRFGIGQNVPLAQSKKSSLTTCATLTLRKSLPGHLSEEGPRHDNDHADIRNISILPTQQEIQSARSEYLPPSNADEWHLHGLPGLLDRNFRLLKEDTVGQLRDAANFELERLSQAQAGEGVPTRARQRMRTHAYEHITVEDIDFDAFRGLQFVIGFDQPKQLKGKSKSERQDWWEGSKRLGSDALVCLLSSAGSATFLVVTAAPAPAAPKTNDAGVSSFHTKYNLWRDGKRGHIVAQLVKDDDVRSTFHKILQGDMYLSLVEFPGVLLPAFMPTLKAMQRMSASLDLPFVEVLAPTSLVARDDARGGEVDPPAYASRPGFKFDLTAITNDNTEIALRPAHNLEGVVRDLVEHSSLDHAQSVAVVQSLSRKVALIQGPPGTGKSYTGGALVKALLANKAVANLGPILYVTYTNHALDQGSERLLDDGVSQIVRIGGRSKSNRMAEVNLRIIAKNEELTKTEKSDRWRAKINMLEETEEINNILRDVGEFRKQAPLSFHFKTNHPEHYQQLFEKTDEDGFTKVTHAKTDRDVLESWLRDALEIHHLPRTVRKLQRMPLDTLDKQERRTLVQSWKDELEEPLQHKLEIVMQAYSTAKQDFDRVRTEKDTRVLRQANVIGITTSGLAKSLDLLRRVNAKVLIVEEAGEVLEAHLLTALLPTIEHVILIGDHQQLRPQIQNWLDLSVESHGGGDYALDVSLFERLVQPRNSTDAPPVPFCSLEIQRRMHPSISDLIRKTVYPHLQDSATVLEYPSIVGLKKRLYWMNHPHLEDEKDDVHSTSHTNEFECNMVTALVSHLVRQGVYRYEDVAVITPYLGQLRQIRNKLAKTMEIVLNERDEIDLAVQDDDEASTNPNPPRRMDVAKATLSKAVRIATVDNFQGEEAKVIVVSLVRSNDKNKPGFLRTTNRINVLLSRAQHGMYIFGNFQTMANVPVWHHVLDLLAADGNVGDSLKLCCPRHPDTPMLVQAPEDFLRLSSEAGCDLLCDKQLPCGHACVAKCHSELLHEAVYCMKPCTRPKEGCKHNCPRVCGDLCNEKCFVTVSDLNVLLDCGHIETSLPCHLYQDPTKIQCRKAVQAIIPGCQHEVTKHCYIDVNTDSYRCSATCGAILSCGHRCTRPCSDCRRRDELGYMVTDHSICRQVCNRNYSTCNHRCQSACHEDLPCGLCEQKCDSKCAHSACGKKCHEPCVPCAEAKCTSHCPHSTYRMPCAAPCDWLPCSLRCTEQLACGCQCPSLCGEVCPGADRCQNCASDDVKSMQADLLMFEAYREIDLNKDPCIFTECGHIFTVSSLDGFMAMSEYYEICPDTDKVTAMKSTTASFSSQELKTCPECRGSLRNVSRYGLIIRRACLDESTKKLATWSHRRRHVLSESLASEQSSLLSSMGKALKPAEIVTLRGSTKAILDSMKKLQTFARY